MAIISKLWGKLENGAEIRLYKLGNKDIGEVLVSDYGCTITHFLVKNHKSEVHDVVLGHDSFIDFINDKSYFGCIVGPFANRIAHGRFKINNEAYFLDRNLGEHHLHGGAEGLDKKIWKVEKHLENEIEFSFFKHHLAGGHPGNIIFKVNYKINEAGSFVMETTAQTDIKTHINLTNHTYFNFSAGAKDILNYKLKINSNKIIEVDEEIIPTGNFLEIADGVFDFILPRVIGSRIHKTSDLQLRYGNGYDHCYVVNGPEGELNEIATVQDDFTELNLKIESTEPGVQLYTANHLNNLKVKGGLVVGKHYGLCLETQHFPDAPNHPNFKSTLLSPNNIYKSITKWTFS